MNISTADRSSLVRSRLRSASRWARSRCSGSSCDKSDQLCRGGSDTRLGCRVWRQKRRAASQQISTRAALGVQQSGEQPVYGAENLVGPVDSIRRH